MLHYRLCTLYSGSKGNAAYLETPHARILIDAGKCARTLIGSLADIGVDIDTVDAIFITHEHSDHIAALEVLAKHHAIPVHMLYESARHYERRAPEALCRCLQIYRRTPFTVTVGDLTVTSFRTPHDSRASVGYHIDLRAEDGIHRIGYATDIGYVTEEIRRGLYGCESVVLESNHDIEMLMTGPYPYDLKMRIRSQHGHLSNTDCADFAAELAEQGTENLLLAHLSENNNTPELAYNETYAAVAGYPVHLEVASPCEVTMLVGDAAHPIPKTALETAAETADPVADPVNETAAETAADPAAKIAAETADPIAASAAAHEVGSHPMGAHPVGAGEQAVGL